MCYETQKCAKMRPNFVKRGLSGKSVFWGYLMKEKELRHGSFTVGIRKLSSIIWKPLVFLLKNPFNLSFDKQYTLEWHHVMKKFYWYFHAWLILYWLISWGWVEIKWILKQKYKWYSRKGDENYDSISERIMSQLLFFQEISPNNWLYWEPPPSPQ